MQRLMSSLGSLHRGPKKSASLPSVAQRHFVSPEILRVLRRMPWFPQAFAGYRFQPFAHCLDHSERLQEDLIDSLCTHRLVALESSAPGSGPLDARTQEDPSAERIAELAKAHGPLSVVMAHALGPGQGGRLYEDHHAFVVLFTFLHEGRPIAVAMDGNDLQQNEVMDHVHHYTDHYDLACEDLRTAELLDIQAQLPDRLHVAQLCFRLIDLMSLVEASRAKREATRHLPPTGVPATASNAPGPSRHTNRVRWVANAQVRCLPLPREVEEALIALCKRSPEVIERFEWPLTQRVHWEE